MIVRQLKPREYERLEVGLAENAHIEPMTASYSVTMIINGVEYTVKLQSERHYKIAILQALRIDRDPSGALHKFITEGNILAALLELLIYQGVG